MKTQRLLAILIAGLLISGTSFAQPGNGTTPEDPNTAQPGGSSSSSGSSSTPQQGNPASDTDLWLNPDFKSYVKSLDHLVKLSDDYAQNKYYLALTNYQTGKSIITKMRESEQRYREENATALHLNEKWYWQTLDRKMHEERYISEMKQASKLRAVTYFTRAINHLDQIDNRKMKLSKEYKELLANLYREWSMAQYDLGNIPQIIDILNRYIDLGPEYEAQMPPHKYLASAYGFQEKLTAKYGGDEQLLLYFKRKKNEHLLRATELAYKKNSPEYERLMEIINQDEIIAISPP